MAFAPITPTTTIVIDDTTYQVEGMSDEIKHLVSYYDEWRQKEAEATRTLVLYQAALGQVQQQIATMIENERNKKTEEANAAVEAAETNTEM